MEAGGGRGAAIGRKSVGVTCPQQFACVVGCNDASDIGGIRLAIVPDSRCVGGASSHQALEHAGRLISDKHVCCVPAQQVSNAYRRRNSQTKRKKRGFLCAKILSEVGFPPFDPHEPSRGPAVAMLELLPILWAVHAPWAD